MGEFVIEKYVEVSTSVRAGILYVDPDPRSLSITLQGNMIGSMFIH